MKASCACMRCVARSCIVSKYDKSAPCMLCSINFVRVCYCTHVHLIIHRVIRPTTHLILAVRICRFDSWFPPGKTLAVNHHLLYWFAHTQWRLPSKAGQTQMTAGWKKHRTCVEWYQRRSWPWNLNEDNIIIQNECMLKLLSSWPHIKGNSEISQWQAPQFSSKCLHFYICIVRVSLN